MVVTLGALLFLSDGVELLLYGLSPGLSQWPTSIQIIPTEGEIRTTAYLIVLGSLAFALGWRAVLAVARATLHSPVHQGLDGHDVLTGDDPSTSSLIPHQRRRAAYAGIAGLACRVFTVFVLTTSTRQIVSPNKFESVLVYAGDVLPLLAGAFLLVATEPHAPHSHYRRTYRLTGLLILVGSGLLGLRVDSKSAALVPLVVYALTRWLTRDNHRVSLKTVLGLAFGLVLSLAVFTIAANVRQAVHISALGALAEAQARLGGIHYAAPVVAASLRHIPNGGNIALATTTTVYGLPSTAATGFATTGWGNLTWTYGPWGMLVGMGAIGGIFGAIEHVFVRAKSPMGLATLATLAYPMSVVVSEGDIRVGLLMTGVTVVAASAAMGVRGMRGRIAIRW